MKQYRHLLYSLLLLTLSWQAHAQNLFDAKAADSVTLHPRVSNNDTTYYAALPQITVQHHYRLRFAPLTREEQNDNWRQIRDVKKVLPYAKKLTAIMIETYEYLETLPNDRARNRHLDRIESDLVEEYKPIMKKFTLRQGLLLIKLMDRQSCSTGYELIKAFYGGFKASMYNLFAGFYGGDLKSKYDPRFNREDALTERIIYLIEHNQL